MVDNHNNIVISCRADILSAATRGFWLLVILLFTGGMFNPSSEAAEADKEINTEYQLKAAFIYNFMKFVEWPESISNPEKNISEKKKEPVVLGVLGENYLKEYLNSLSGKTIKDRPIKIVIIEGFDAYKKKNSDAVVKNYLAENRKSIEACHLLLISPSEKEQLAEILKFTEKLPILTVSDISHFAGAGGVIEFVTENNKIRFDVNTVSAEAKKLKISSQLLQLARKVYKKENPK